jgi:hypothetical protein
MCDLPAVPAAPAPPVEFFPYPDVPRAAVATAERIVRAARLDVGGIEYLETPDGRRDFYDINANSNLRPSVAAAFGFDPFERVVDFLDRERNANSDADSSDGQEFDYPAELKRTVRPFSLADRQAQHLRTKEKRMLRCAFAGIDLELLQLLPEKLLDW